MTPSPDSILPGEPSPATSDAPTDQEAAAGHQDPVGLLLGSILRLLRFGLRRHCTGDGADPQCPMGGWGTTVHRVVPGFASQISQLLPLRTFYRIHVEGGRGPGTSGTHFHLEKEGAKAQPSPANRGQRESKSRWSHTASAPCLLLGEICACFGEGADEEEQGRD